MNNKLIIIRGPSASGKSTLAKKLFSTSKSNVVLIQQDYYRYIFNQANEGSKANSKSIHKMIEQNTTIALQAGYDVILEGVLTNKSYQAILERLITLHTGESYLFYFDLSFEETLRRHLKKNDVLYYTENEMYVWYSFSQPLNHSREFVISEYLSEDLAYQKIVHISGLEII
jgi:predicted kinase